MDASGIEDGAAVDVGSPTDAQSFRDGTVDASVADAMLADTVPADTQWPDAFVMDASTVDAGVGCATGMVAVADFCIDRYEAPNEVGQPPLAMQTALAGDEWCRARGKRLCREDEWVRACQGSTGRPFPYGDTYRRSACNDDKTWISPNWSTLGMWPSAAAMAEATRLYQADASGARAECASEEGVFDLTGNVAEWVERSFDHANNYDHVMKGCYWAGCFGGAPPSCAFTNPAHPGGFRSYEAGFRCCANP